MYSLHDQFLHSPPPLPQMNHNWKSSVEIAPNCPRCASSNTKFCYYNNYSLSQPRYFCKGCRRYWTKGGSLRNVPVGGGCRKNRRTKSARFLGTDRDSSKGLGDFDPNRNSPETDPNSLSDIDLAVVFAKFLNNDNKQSSSVESEFVDPELAPADESNSMKSDGSESQNPSDFIDWTQEMPQLLAGDEIHTPVDEQSIPEFWETDLNALGLQNLLNDEAVQDALWPVDAATPAENYEWQPTMQMQEVGSFSGDHDLMRNFPANLASDNWSTSFDQTGFEIFSKP